MKFSWIERVALVAMVSLAALFVFASVLTTLRLVKAIVMTMEFCCEILCRLLVG